MAVAHTGYLKSHPASKQEAQPQKVEQSAGIMNIMELRETISASEEEINKTILGFLEGL